MYYIRRIRYLTYYFHRIGPPMVVAYAEVLRLVYSHHLRVPITEAPTECSAQICCTWRAQALHASENSVIGVVRLPCRHIPSDGYSLKD